MAIKELIVGGGCFWCTEAVFERLKGVLDVESGYANGDVPNPNYRMICMRRWSRSPMMTQSSILIPCWMSSSPSTIPPRSTARVPMWAHSTAPASATKMTKSSKLPNAPSHALNPTTATPSSPHSSRFATTIRQRTTIRTTTAKTLCRATATPSSHPRSRS